MEREILLETAIEAAREAGAIALAGLAQPQQVKSKGLRDIVTEADLRCQERIMEIIGRRFPDHGFLAEEATPPHEASSDYLDIVRFHLSLRGAGCAVARNEAKQSPIADEEIASQKPLAMTDVTMSSYCWIIDPIDGTTNYSRHYPGFSISIALSHGQDLILGVVYDPLYDQLFQAERGRGARLNGQPIRVSPTVHLADALVGAEWARDPELRRRSVEFLVKLAPQVMTLRSLGSAALTLCHLAAGYLDLYVHLSLSPWDIAAAGLIIEEAGGMITDSDGNPFRLSLRAVFAKQSPPRRGLLCFVPRNRKKRSSQ